MSIRVRAHLVLACGQENYLWHAGKAVELVEQGRELFGDGATPGARAALDTFAREAQYVLRVAEADDKEMDEKKAQGYVAWTPSTGRGAGEFTMYQGDRPTREGKQH